MHIFFVAGLLLSARLTNAAASEPALPSDQQLLTFIGNTIDWYRHLPTAQRFGPDPADVFFLEDNRPTAMEIVRLSFQFGKAVAAVQAQHRPAADPAPTAGDTAVTREVGSLSAARAKLDADVQQATRELQLAAQARFAARGGERKKLDAQIANIRSRIQLLNAISANYQNLVEFVRNVNADRDEGTTLAALVGDLERTAPDVSPDAPAKVSNMPADPPRGPHGITGMISRVSALSGKRQIIDTAIERTDALMRSLQNLRTPFRNAFEEQMMALSLDGKSLDVLEQQQSRLADTVARVQATSPAISALIQQHRLLNVYKLHLAEWRSDIRMQYRGAWKALLVRMALLAAVIAALLGSGMLMGRLTYTHVRDPETRQMVLLAGRVLLWVIVVAVILFAFAFDGSSLATFLGLLTAGLAVGLHDVFLAVGGRLLLVRRFRIRVGDRVEIAGVKGEVTKLGLMEFTLKEVDAASGQPTGRAVFFSNSYVFVSPATPLFRQLSAPA